MPKSFVTCKPLNSNPSPHIDILKDQNAKRCGPCTKVISYKSIERGAGASSACSEMIPKLKSCMRPWGVLGAPPQGDSRRFGSGIIWEPRKVTSAPKLHVPDPLFPPITTALGSQTQVLSVLSNASNPNCTHVRLFRAVAPGRCAASASLERQAQTQALGTEGQ